MAPGRRSSSARFATAWGDPRSTQPLVAPIGPTPDRIEVRAGALPHPTLRLRKPIGLRVEREGPTVAVWSDDLEEAGHGEHPTEAAEDFAPTVAELDASLREEAARDRLGPAMADPWTRLQTYVEERHGP